jgi:hypothetical protein
MKNLFLAVIFTVSSVALYAQRTITCTSRDVCQYNESTKKHDNCETQEEASVFKINAEESEFQHTTPTMNSTYYVQSREYPKGGNKIFAVTSDAGNNYTFIVDEKKKELRILTYMGVVIKFKISKIEK